MVLRHWTREEKNGELTDVDLIGIGLKPVGTGKDVCIWMYQSKDIKDLRRPNCAYRICAVHSRIVAPQLNQPPPLPSISVVFTPPPSSSLKVPSIPKSTELRPKKKRLQRPSPTFKFWVPFVALQDPPSYRIASTKDTCVIFLRHWRRCGFTMRERLGWKATIVPVMVDTGRTSNIRGWWQVGRCCFRFDWRRVKVGGDMKSEVEMITSAIKKVEGNDRSC
ncbi:hypothetical protein BJ165DRAFT_1405525 [Panaeolus papilionaceus]|nr:hypothetical protein BJ165DRAFT_1405525 [Panaeolus papilionaceus]